jgi:ubiquinone/menaquinone biosynthesis C-methylase UbiE
MSQSTAILAAPPAAFDALAEHYDDAFTNTLIGRAQRAVVWSEIDRQFKPGQNILEINCGTGVDALHLAERGVRVVACDASPGMIAAARRRLACACSIAPVDLRVLPTEELGRIEGDASFDGAFSNFAGLNCVEDLSSVGAELGRLLKPGGKMILCVFGRWCAWEILWYLARGDVRKAQRRLGREGCDVCLTEGASVRVSYPSVGDLRRSFAPWFRLEEWKGVGVAVPPSYAESIAEQYPRALHAAEILDRVFGRIPVVKGLADHFLLTFERTAN